MPPFLAGSLFLRPRRPCIGRLQCVIFVLRLSLVLGMRSTAVPWGCNCPVVGKKQIQIANSDSTTLEAY